jgi:positive regulator of sigma E activity
MSNKVKKDVVANTLITYADISLIIIASIIVSLVFVILSESISFVKENDLIVFTIFEVVAFVCVLAYKRWK